MLRWLCIFILIAGFAPPTFALSDGDLPSSHMAEGKDWWRDFTAQIDMSGFTETRVAVRLQGDQFQKPFSLAETRFQFEAERELGAATLNLTADVYFDAVSDQHEFGFDGDAHIFDLRQATIEFSPLDFMDVKLGRQVLTWGTGDLLFINDLFPKDWRAFLLGRDDEYLKAPTQAMKASFYFDRLSLDVVYVPEFVTDRFVNGSRISYFDPKTGDLNGRPDVVTTIKPEGWLEKDELSLRLFGTFASVEVAAYYYDGYWKSPGGSDISLGVGTFPRLKVYGSSVRSAIWGGIGSAEIGYYDGQDRSSMAPFNRNDEVRFLAGYERDLGGDLTIAFQYNFERKLRSSALSTGASEQRTHHVITQRITKQLWQQTFTFSLFNFYSPSGNDGHLRLKLSYKINDAVKLESGFNFFYGRTDETFFGQFQKASNVSAAMKVSF